MQIATQAETNDVVQLWPNTAPGAEKWLGATNLEESLVRPTLTIFLPSPAKATGTGMLIIPGGGYSGCAYTYEGFDIAHWCNERGIAAFVLRYRRPVAKKQRLYDHTIPAMDARRALRLIRNHATEWHVHPDKLGVMGFSAGGHLASTLGVHFDVGQPAATDPVEHESSRPDFLTLVYAVISMQEDGVGHGGSRNNLMGETSDPQLLDYYSSDCQVTSNTPPAFIVCSTADKVVSAENSTRMYLALKAHGVPAELHIFEQGAHGFAMRTPNLPVTTYWPTLFQAERTWLGHQTLTNGPFPRSGKLW